MLPRPSVGRRATVLVLISECELNRIEVLSRILEGRLSVASAASVLALNRRQVHRLIARFRVDGAAAIRHKARGRRSNNRIRDGVRARYHARTDRVAAR